MQRATEIVKIQATFNGDNRGVHDVFRLQSGQQPYDKRSFVVSVVYVMSTISVPYLRSYS